MSGLVCTNEAEAHVSPLIWSHTCTTGVQSMDDQHGILMDCLNELRNLLSRGGDPKDVRETLVRLTALTMMHFESEEALLQSYAFPGLTEHRREHHRLLTQLADFANHPNPGSNGAAMGLAQFLRDWFIAHVEGLDQAYGPWLLERGVK